MNNTNKMAYIKPEISKIEIDNEISVVLMSPNGQSQFIPVGQGDGGINNGDMNGDFNLD
jgi:hypothetical protein